MTCHGESDGTSATIKRVEPMQWALLRAIRHEALRQDPDAFGAVYGDDAIKPPVFWTTASMPASGS